MSINLTKLRYFNEYKKLCEEAGIPMSMTMDNSLEDIYEHMTGNLTITKQFMEDLEVMVVSLGIHIWESKK